MKDVFPEQPTDRRMWHNQEIPENIDIEPNTDDS